MFENPRRGRQARNFTTNVPKILDLKSYSEQIFSENCRWVPLIVVILDIVSLNFVKWFDIWLLHSSISLKKFQVQACAGDESNNIDTCRSLSVIATI